MLTPAPTFKITFSLEASLPWMNVQSLWEPKSPDRPQPPPEHQLQREHFLAPGQRSGSGRADGRFRPLEPGTAPYAARSLLISSSPPGELLNCLHLVYLDEAPFQTMLTSHQGVDHILAFFSFWLSTTLLKGSQVLPIAPPPPAPLPPSSSLFSLYIFLISKLVMNYHLYYARKSNASSIRPSSGPVVSSPAR